jgi:hypothetical protein
VTRKCLLNLAAVAASVVLSSCTAIAADVRGTLETESSLFFRNNGNRLLVKHLQPTQEFQGFAITRDGNVFLAYSGTTSEATTKISIYDVTLKTERVMIELGATGATEFSYDVATDLVAFNWVEGVYVFALDAVRKIRPDPARLQSFLKSIILVAKCGSCSPPRWTEDGRISYSEYEKNGLEQRKYATVPEAALPASVGRSTPATGTGPR